MKPSKPTATRGAMLILGVLGCLWVFSLAVGIQYLVQEQFTPVEPSPVSAEFPRDSSLLPPSSHPLLIIFIHPQCPCSRASLRELALLRDETGNNLSVEIVFSLPEGVPQGWEKGDLMTLANAIPGANLIMDHGGAEAKRFGVRGSGHVLLYNPAGQLLFQGGITPSRSHEGENAGRTAITDLVLHGQSEVRQTPVFGCSLL